MKYLNEIAELCLSFVDKEKSEYNCKIYSPRETKNVKFASHHSLGMIYLYSLSTKIKKDLIKAEKHIEEAIKLNEKSEPYYTRLLYKIKKKLL